jgi:glycosyltransferase involved in cell wall biosynthesis
MKICHLTSVHKYNDIRIFVKECTSLAKKHEVSLICVNGIDAVVNNVKIINVPVNYTGRLQRFTKVVDAVYKKAIETDAEIFHLHDPELLRIAIKLKRQGKKVIYDAHEDLPRQLLSKPYLNKNIAKILSKLVEAYENKVAAKIDGIITATPHIKERFIKVNPQTENINNYPIIEELNYIKDINKTADNRAGICYIGGITQIRGIFEMVNAMQYVNNDIKLELAGAFSPDSLAEQVHKLPGWKNVNYHGYVNRHQVAEILSNSFAGLLVLHPTINHKDSLPIKMFEYMLFGLPVIASDFPLWREIIEKNNCGVCVNPLNEKQIANAINYFYSHPDKAREMGENGKKLVMDKYNWANEETKLIKFYEKINTAI